MQNQLTPLFAAHIAAGSVMLTSGLVAICAHKADNYHRIAGKIYVYAAILIALTGFAIAVQKSNLFLIATSPFVLYMVLSGYRSLYLKRLYKEKKAEPIDWLLVAFAALTSFGLLLFGGYSLANGNKSGIVPLVFGILCARFLYRDVSKFVKGPADAKHWLYNHISGMLGSYIAGLTAFLAVNAPLFTKGFSLIVWLGPTIIGVPLIVYIIGKYKAKGADLKQELGLKIAVATQN